LDLSEDPTQLRGPSPFDFTGEQRQRRNPVIEVELSAAAYELVRDGVTVKSRKSGVYKVLMARNLAARLDAARAVGEDVSDVILRLAQEAKATASRHPLG
jgi:hypothetical protein